MHSSTESVVITPVDATTINTATMRRHAQELFLAGINAAHPRTLTRNAMRLDRTPDGATVLVVQPVYGKALCFELDHYHHVLVVGCGKAAVPMAQAVEELLKARIEQGLITTKYGFAKPTGTDATLERIAVLEAAHPVPDEAGLRAAMQTLQIAKQATEHDLIINLVSGGGSALWMLPAEGLTLSDVQRLTELLLASGATIHQMNCVRKHITQLQGGQLAKRTRATILSLILSDVVGDVLDVIASGPTVTDTTTFADALSVLEHYSLIDQAPKTIIEYLQRGTAGHIQETPKTPPVNATNALIGSNVIALQHIKELAQSLGYNVVIEDTALQGEAREVAIRLVQRALSLAHQAQAREQPLCLIAGGETTVTVHGTGIGGRNQEMALAAALELHGRNDLVFLSGGTDGNDGPTNAAGGLVDGQTIERGKAQEKNPYEALRNNDSYHFLQATGDLVITGATQTNVMDIQILLHAGTQI